METNREVRQANLRILVKEAKGQRKLADKLDVDKNQIWQWLIKDEEHPQARNISNPTARDMERICGKPKGWMDTPHPDGQSAATSLSNRVVTPEQHASGDVLALQLAMRALVTTVLTRVQGTAEPFAALLKKVVENIDFGDDAGLVGSLLGIAGEARNTEEAVVAALLRERSGGRTKPKK